MYTRDQVIRAVFLKQATIWLCTFGPYIDIPGKGKEDINKHAWASLVTNGEIEKTGKNKYKHKKQWHFSPRVDGAPASIGYIKEDTQEASPHSGRYFKKAWRVIDSNGKDMTQPWFNTKKELYAICKILRIYVYAK